jgi:hypothetical protein
VAKDSGAPEFKDLGGRVMIVEDNAIVLESLAGEEALRVAEDEHWRFGAIGRAQIGVRLRHPEVNRQLLVSERDVQITYADNLQRQNRAFRQARAPGIAYRLLRPVLRALGHGNTGLFL